MSPAHFHLVLNHVPVIGMVIAIGLLAWAVLRRDERLVRVCLGLFAVLAVAGVAAFLTGEPAEEVVEGLAGVSESAVEQHEEAARLAMIAMGALGLLSLACLFWFRKRLLPRQVAMLLLAAALVPAGAMAWTANLGGRIRHAEIRADRTAPPEATFAERPDHAEEERE